MKTHNFGKSKQFEVMGPAFAPVLSDSGICIFFII